jgi:hypothetical protein
LKQDFRFRGCKELHLLPSSLSHTLFVLSSSHSNVHGPDSASPDMNSRFPFTHIDCFGRIGVFLVVAQLGA